MDLGALIVALQQPAAYPFAVDAVEVKHTHISVVFLAGGLVYKIKKPVALGFLDFTTLEKRRFYCEEEVRLNRRLAGDVYLGVVPIAHGPAGLQCEGSGDIVEYAVKMRRLPESATLRDQLHGGAIAASHIAALARKIAAFHASADADPAKASFGSFANVARNARDNLTAARVQVDDTVSAAVLERLTNLNESALQRLHALIDARAARGLVRDTHGDMHLSHVYRFPERPPPDDLVIIDCIEFNEALRFADPIADMAFLYMDLKYHGRRDLAETFANAYFAASGDAEGQSLLPFYSAYRAAVRGKVEGIQAASREVPAADRLRTRLKARAHWLIALGELEEAGRRPCLVLVGGLQGTGKSTLARALADRAGFAIIRSDVVRKELAGLAETERADDSCYSPEWHERTYAECLRRAEEQLFAGQRVLVDATFNDLSQRRAFLEAGRRLGVPAVLLICQANDEIVRRRLARRAGDASDANWTVYQQAARTWPAPDPDAVLIDTSGTVERAVEQALAHLPAHTR